MTKGEMFSDLALEQQYDNMVKESCIGKTTAVEHGINYLWNLQALFKQQIKDAYNQGYREGLEDRNCEQLRDVSECSNAENYYNETFKK